MRRRLRTWFYHRFVRMVSSMYMVSIYSMFSLGVEALMEDGSLEPHMIRKEALKMILCLERRLKTGVKS